MHGEYVCEINLKKAILYLFISGSYISQYHPCPRCISRRGSEPEIDLGQEHRFSVLGVGPTNKL